MRPSYNTPMFQHTGQFQIRTRGKGLYAFTALTPTRLSIPVVAGQMALGAWQGIYLFEHRREPQSRRVAAHLLGA
ncbi:MAG: YjbQ family protein [Betaproteobacteria bacterium]|nr:YjbQ family protein [Betaproteobacteria bacterium]